MVLLGERHERGDDGPKNMTLASQFYEKAAKAGSIHGMRACARVANGRLSRALELRDLDAALRFGGIAANWMREAAAVDDSESMLGLASFSQLGIASETPEESFNLLREAAESGVSYTLLHLAACYLIGKGTAPDAERALDLIRRTEAVAKREGNAGVEKAARRILAEKTTQGQVSLIRHEIGWPTSDETSPVPPAPENSSRLAVGQRVTAVRESENDDRATIWRADGEKWAQGEFFSHGLDWPAVRAGTELKVLSDTGPLEDPWRLVKVEAADVLIWTNLRDGNFSPDRSGKHVFLIVRRTLRVKP
jgi:hypothetical protein